MSSLERRQTCLRHQFVIARCGVSEMRCLLCNKTIVKGSGKWDLEERCSCMDAKPRQTEKRAKRTKISKRAGALLKERFTKKKGYYILANKL